MEWIDLFMNYTPINEQEKKDKELILNIINTYEDVLSRNNEIAHITSSAFVVNNAKDKVLMVHHNIYNSWSWTGGHADGESNFLDVAIREAKEETGITNLVPISFDIFSLDILPVLGHFKRGKYVSAHLHLSVTYLFEADESNPLITKEDENSGVKWISMNEIDTFVSESHMLTVYKKLISKMKSGK